MTWTDSVKSLGHNMTLSTGDEVYIEGFTSDAVYILLTGKFSLYLNAAGQKIICSLNPGDIFGAEGLVQGTFPAFTARAESECTVLRLPKENALAVLNEHPSFAVAIIKSLSNTLSTFRDEYFKLSKNNGNSAAAANPKVSVAADIAFFPQRKYSSSGLVTPAETRTITEKKTGPEPAAKPETSYIPPAPVPAAIQSSVITAVLPPNHPVYDITESEESSRFVTLKELTCPICNKDFSDYAPLSFKLKAKEVTFDMRTIYNDFEPLWYAITICPGCNAAVLSQSFTKFTSYEKSLMDKSNYGKTVPRFTGWKPPRTINQVLESYYLALQFQSIVTKDPLSEAQLWRRLMWLYGDVGDEAQKAHALDMTIEKYNNTFQNKHISGSEEFQMNVILGDLYYMKKDRGTSYKHYLNAVHAEDKSNQALLRHASDMMLELRGKT